MTLPIFSVVIWSSSICYFLYSFYIGLNGRLRRHLGDDLFTTGWIPYLNEVDTTDPEWSTFKDLCIYLVPGLFIHVIAVQLVPSRFHLACRIVISLGFFVITFGIKCTAILLTVFGITAILQRCTHKSVIYIVNIFIIFIAVYQSETLLAFTNRDEHISVMFEICLAWSAVRAISFGISAERNFLLSLSYFLYLPGLVVGPLVTYSLYKKQIDRDELPTKSETLVRFLKFLPRLVLWIFIIEFLDHTLYTTAVRFDYQFVREHLTMSEYFGFSVMLMGRFYLKYLFMYGIGEKFASLENIWMPERPRCTLRITSSGEVWRTFDRGLYFWFLETIYIPLNGSFVASMLCFIFVCFWHSGLPEIQIWTAVNFLLVIAERFVFRLSIRPLSYILQCPLHWLAVGSNMFYLGGYEVGMDFFSRLAEPRVFCVAVVISLCGCSVGRYFQTKDRQYFRKNQLNYKLIE